MTPDGRPGVVSGVRLNGFSCAPSELPVGGAQDVLELQVRVTVPESGCRECVLSFVDGLQGLGQPVLIRARTAGRTILPSLEAQSLKVLPAASSVPATAIR